MIDFIEPNKRYNVIIEDCCVWAEFEATCIYVEWDDDKHESGWDVKKVLFDNGVEFAEMGAVRLEEIQ